MKTKGHGAVDAGNGWLHHPSLCLCTTGSTSASISRARSSPQPISIGLDAYRAWDQWPRQRIEMRTSCTALTTGRQSRRRRIPFPLSTHDDFNVTLDVGARELFCSAATTADQENPWHYVVDSTEPPSGPGKRPKALLSSGPDSTFLPLATSRSPLNETWATTPGRGAWCESIFFCAQLSNGVHAPL